MKIQLPRMERSYLPNLESSKFRHTAIALLLTNGIMEFIVTIHSESNWKIGVLKTGGLIYFSLASTSPDMTQPADNINLVTTRHLSKTMNRTNDVIIYAADMQTQNNVSNDKDEAITSQFKHCVINDIINDIINDENQYDVSKQIFRMQSGSRDFVTNNGCREELHVHFEECKGTVDIHCSIRPNSCNYGNKDTARFPKGIISYCYSMKIISLYNTECSQIQYSSGDNGTESDMGTMDVQCTSDHDGPRPVVEALVQNERFRLCFKKEAEEAIAAMMASNLEQIDSRSGLREKDSSIPTTIGKKSHNESQATAHTQDMLEEMFRAICYIKSEVRNFWKALNGNDAAKNVEATIQKRKPFGPCNNDKHEKPPKFANTAIQKNVSRSYPLSSRIATMTEFDGNYDEVTAFAGIIQKITLYNDRILTAQNNESALGSVFSRFYWDRSRKHLLEERPEFHGSIPSVLIKISLTKILFKFRDPIVTHMSLWSVIR